VKTCGRPPTLLWRPGRRLKGRLAGQRPHVGRRAWPLLCSGLAAAMLAPAAAGASPPTTTEPAPDPNPPKGIAPDPYTRPKPRAPVAHQSSRSALKPAYTPSFGRTRSDSVVGVPSASRVTAPVSRETSESARQAKRNRQTKRSDVLRKPHGNPRLLITSPLDSVPAVASAQVVATAGGGNAGRRRAAGFALVLLVATSFSLVLLVRRLSGVRGVS
jgi:hypothetical protein